MHSYSPGCLPVHSTPGAWPETDDFTMSWGQSAFWKSPCLQWRWEWGNGTRLGECLLYTVPLDQLHVRKEAGLWEGLLQTRSDRVCVSHLWKPVPGFKENKVSWRHLHQLLHQLLHRGSAKLLLNRELFHGLYLEYNSIN